MSDTILNRDWNRPEVSQVNNSGFGEMKPNSRMSRENLSTAQCTSLPNIDHHINTQLALGEKLIYVNSIKEGREENNKSGVDSEGRFIDSLSELLDRIS